ncbi:MAG: transposase domain-containing protein, partial [Ktedonobacteraceae bacterium]|nr:transposase domain-containing protein [Ktedonobacteraceae bacterium]
MTTYRLRQMEIDDKVCEQINLKLVEHIYPKEVIERCLQQSGWWGQKQRRIRQTTVVSLVWLLIAMALWSRLNQSQVWQKLVGHLRTLHPLPQQGKLSDSGISGRRQELGSEPLQGLFKECCVVLSQPGQPGAFFGRYRIMAIDGTVFRTADTPANEQAFGRSHNQFGKGAFPQVRAVLLAECATHAVVGLELSR